MQVQELKVKRVIKDALDLDLKMEFRLFTSYVPFAHDNPHTRIFQNCLNKVKFWYDEVDE